MATPIIVAVSGAAGQIAYSLLPLLAEGSVFGEDQPIILHLLDITPMLDKLKGVAMEIDDCCYPLVHGNHYVRSDDSPADAVCARCGVHGLACRSVQGREVRHPVGRLPAKRWHGEERFVGQK